MKRILLAGTLALAATAAQAVEVEVSAGASRYTYYDDNMWYQEGTPHNNRMWAPMVSIGLIGDLLPHLQWRAGYAYLGNITSNAMAAPDLSDYHDGVGGYDPATKQCRGPCGPKRQFAGHGHVQGLYLTLQPYVDVKGYRLAVEGGPFLFHSSWRVTAHNTDNAPQWLQAETFPYNPPAVELGWILGASVSHGPWSAAYQFYSVPASKRPDPTIWRNVHVLSLRYRF